MKTLTIKEPWASLIINGYKNYEFRSWQTKYRGKILIHAGKTLEKEMVNNVKDYNFNYTLGAIIGEAMLVNCIKVTPKFMKDLKNINNLVYGTDHSHNTTYAWQLENIKNYDNPIIVKGQLGLWNYYLVHQMKLNSEPFKLIKQGTKTIELRLNDEKRQLLNINDYIEFTNRKTMETIKTKIINFHYYPNFKELYKHFDKIKLGYSKETTANYKDMEIYYSLKEQSKYGVVGIEIERV